MANFFDKVVVGINKGVNTVSEGSKTFVEKAKLNTQLQDYKKERDKTFQNIGMFIYNLQVKGELNIEQCREMFSTINELNKNIEELEAQIRSLESGRQYVSPSDGIVCSCGCVNVRDSKFCAACGKPLSAAPAAEPEGRICGGCGTMNKPSARFCVGCGQPL